MASGCDEHPDIEGHSRRQRTHVTTGAEVLVLAVLALPIVSAFIIVRRERMEVTQRIDRPFWVTLGITLAIAIPFLMVAGMIIAAMFRPDALQPFPG
jgi:quinol-cytochrome oxidoreductase complex cytochrome b subunit